MRPLSIGKPVHQGGANKPLLALSRRIPTHVLAPDGDGESEGQGPSETRPELFVALVIPLNKYVDFAKWVKKNVRILKPKGWEGEVTLTVLPDIGEEYLDLEQYEVPQLTVTKLPENSK